MSRPLRSRARRDSQGRLHLSIRVRVPGDVNRKVFVVQRPDEGEDEFWSRVFASCSVVDDERRKIGEARRRKRQMAKLGKKEVV